MPNKLTDTEIIKALEEYVSYLGSDKYIHEVLTSALDLINRQEFRIHQQEKTIMEIQNANLIDFKATIGNYIAENESLKEKNSNLTSDLSSLQNDLISAKAEVERLADRNHKCIYLSDDETTEYCVDGPCPNYKTVAQIKAEAYKEFAERYKTLLETELHWCECADEIIKPLNNLLNELVGE